MRRSYISITGAPVITGPGDFGENLKQASTRFPGSMGDVPDPIKEIISHA